jgi:hypothetical protein
MLTLLLLWCLMRAASWADERMEGEGYYDE